MWFKILLGLGIAPIYIASHLPLPQEPLARAPESKKLSLTHDLIGLHQNLTAIESISGNEKEIGEWLASSLETQGYSVEKQTVNEDPLRFNLYAWPGSNRNASVVLSSHIDTVPPFLPYRRNKTTISGRGSVDAKGSVATQIIALNNLLASNRINADEVAVLYVVGEEVGGEGMRKANDLALRPSTVIFGEPTEGKLVAGHKGITEATIKVKGKAAHSGYPWLGRSANEILVAALGALIKLGDELPSSEKYGKTTINIGKIEGGVAGNVVAESAQASMTVRIADGSPKFVQDEITKAVYRAVSGFLEGEMEPKDLVEIDFPGRGYSPIDIDADISGFEVMTVNYGTDIPWLKKADKDQKRYLYGPGSIFVAHGDHEALEISDLWKAVYDYERIILHAFDKA